MGVDAYLLLYKNEISHFLPENDTLKIEEWSEYIVQTCIPNGGKEFLFGNINSFRNELVGYDAYVANGIAPALFYRLGIRLSIFAPYGEGIEHIIDSKFIISNLLRSFLRIIIRRWQILGLRFNTSVIISANLHNFATKTATRYRLPSTITEFFPMVFVENSIDINEITKISKQVERMKSSNMVVLSHVSHIWKTLPSYHLDSWPGKGNDILIRGFAKYLEISKKADSVLCLFEYGIDVDNSKKLISELRINDNVIWFPLLSRKEILGILPLVNIGGSEFSGEMWGGCGWEFITSGVPMFHRLDHADRYENAGLVLPKFFNVNNDDDIARVLLNWTLTEQNKTRRELINWANSYQNEALAKKWLEILKRVQ